MHTEYLQKVKCYGIAYGHFRISNIFVRVSDLFAVVCNTFCTYVSQCLSWQCDAKVENSFDLA